MKILICSLAFAVLCAQSVTAGQGPEAGGTLQPPQAPPALSATIRAVKEAVQPRSRVELEVTVRNDSNRIQPYPTWGPMYYTKFDVRDSQGNQPLTRRGRALLLHEGLSDEDVPRGSQSGQPVEPGKTITVRDSVPEDIFDLTKAGAYAIRLHIPWGKGFLDSNTITVNVVPGATPYVAPTPQPSISATIHAVGGTTVSAGGKVTLGVVTKNISNHYSNQRTTRDTRDLARFYRVDVRDSQGDVPPETELGQASGNRGDAPPPWLGPNPPPFREDVGGKTYAPGEERAQIIVVNEVYDLSQPGEYTIQVRRWDDDTKTWVKSNTITLTVTP